jgi:DNA-binding NarL/FixJ family response regulator
MGFERQPTKASRPSKAVDRKVQRGLSNKEIAHRRGVSEQAVKRHVSALFRHFGVDSRARLIALMFETERKPSAPT